MNKVVKKSDITVRVGLDEKSLPQTLHWMAEGSPDGGMPKPAKALIMALFDGQKKETLKIDLWTEEFQVHEMNQFMFETLNALSETFYRATKNEKVANEMKMFAQHFGEATELIKPTKGDNPTQGKK